MPGNAAKVSRTGMITSIFESSRKDGVVERYPMVLWDDNVAEYGDKADPWSVTLSDKSARRYTIRA